MEGGRHTRSGQLGLTAVDLFCGAGGLSQGFQNAGFEVTFALDRDFDSCETYRVNHPSTKIEHAAITDLTPRALAGMVGEADVIVGGPSCQGFSTQGRSRQWYDPNDERNKLWRHMAHIVKEVAPKAFLLENVPGLVYFSNNRIGEQIIRRFEKLGYRVHHQILLAADYGVPQLRRRVFVVGVQEGIDFRFPEPTHLGAWRRDSIEKWEAERLRRGLLRHVTCWEAIADLPRLRGGLGAKQQRYQRSAAFPFAEYLREDSAELLDHEILPLWKSYAKLLSYVPRGGSWRDIPSHLLPDRYRGGMRRTDSTNLLGRLDPDRPAYTITTQFNNVTAGCFTHPFEDRPLSVREGARLQSFPDSYAFTGTLTSSYRQVGNAVPPMLAQHLACVLAQAILDGQRRRRPRRPPTIASVHEASPKPASTTTRARMTRQGRHDTGPEVHLRRALFRLGLRYRINTRPISDLRREADIVFPTEQVAVFVDGCFWHGCPKHSRPTKSNTKWWADKIERNRRRDEETTATLKREGWRVVRIWEHEDPLTAAPKVMRAVQARRRMAGSRR